MQGDRRGGRRHAGKGDDDLGRAGARPLPPADPPGATGGRLRRPSDDAVLLSDLPGTPTDPAGIDDPPDRGRTTSRTASGSAASSWSGIPTTAGVAPRIPDRIVWTIETDPHERIRATEQDANDFTPVFAYPDAVVRDLDDKYGMNRPGGRVPQPLPTPSSKHVFAFNPKSRRRSRAPAQLPLRKAINYALDRPALPTCTRLPVGDTYRPPAPGGAEPRADGSTRSAGRIPHGAEVARDAPRQRPRTLTLYTAETSHSASERRTVFRSTT